MSQAIRPFGLESPCRFCDGLGCSLCGGQKKRSKFNVDNSPEGKAKRTVDGHLFASQAEAKRYTQLKLLKAAGHIRGDIELQPVYKIEIDGKPICKYLADFRYFAGTTRICEDVKGRDTAESRLKRKLVEALYPGTKITIVKMRGRA